MTEALLDVLTRERDALRAALSWYADRDNYALRGVEHDFAGTGHAYVKPIGPAPVMIDQGQRSRDALAKLANGE